jgi:hypothetical protein
LGGGDNVQQHQQEEEGEGEVSTAAAAAAAAPQALDAAAAAATFELLARMADTAMMYQDTQELEGVVQAAAAAAAAHALQQQGEMEYLLGEDEGEDECEDECEVDFGAEEDEDLQQQQQQQRSADPAAAAEAEEAGENDGVSNAAHWSSASLVGGGSTVAGFDADNEDDADLQKYVEGASAVGSVRSFGGSSSRSSSCARLAAESESGRVQHAMAGVAAAAAGGKMGGVLLGSSSSQQQQQQVLDEMPTPHFWRHPAVVSPVRSASSPGTLVSLGQQQQQVEKHVLSSPAAAAAAAASLAHSSTASPLPFGSLSPGMMFPMSPVGMTPAPADVRTSEQQQREWAFGSSTTSPAAANAGSPSAAAAAAAAAAAVGSPIDSPGSGSLSGISFAHPSPLPGQSASHNMSHNTSHDDSYDNSPVLSGGAARSPPRVGATFRAHGLVLGVPRLNLAAISSSSSDAANRGGSSVGQPIPLPPIPGDAADEDEEIAESSGGIGVPKLDLSAIKYSSSSSRRKRQQQVWAA